MTFTREKFRKHSAISPRQVCVMEKIARELLDENYDLLYDYFCTVLDSEEEYKILRARRCEVLFQIFVPIILKNEQKIEIHGEFLSSHAIVKYKEKIGASSALILDDIVIHGRGIQDLYEELDPDYQSDKIRVYVHKVARNADAMKDSFKRRMFFDSKVFDWEWRELSTQLVNVIQATATPYVSYVETYVNIQDIDMSKLENDFIVCDNTNQDQKFTGTESFVFFEKRTLPRIIQNGSYDACVRYYKNEKMEKGVLAPYVFMKPISDSDIDTFFYICAEDLSEKYNALKQELQSERKNDLDLKYKAYLLNVLLNQIYTLYLGHKYGDLFDFSHAEWFTLAMCFGNDVADDIENLLYNDICGLLDQEVCRMEYQVHDEETDLIAQLDKAKTDATEDEILPLYFYLSREIDEMGVQNKEQRKQGLSVQTFYQKLGQDIHRSSKLQLSSWDAGTAACDLIVLNNRFVAAYVKAGEQSFRYIVRKCNERVQHISEQRNRETVADQLVDQFLEAHGACLCEWGISETNY